MIIFGLIISSNPVPAQAPQLAEEDDKEYFGYHYGAAGIALALLKSVDSGLLTSDISNDANTAISKALEYVWANRLSLDDGTKVAAWSKFEGAEIFPGQKYGAAGIAKIYGHAYNMSDNPIYLEYAISAMDEIFLEVSDINPLPRWAYAYPNVRRSPGDTTNEIALTDMKFGSLGVIDSLLDLYDYTGEFRFLERGLETLAWIKSISTNRTVGNETNLIIPWYKLDGAVSPYLTGFGQGNAGLIPILFRLHALTNDAQYSNWANFILKWLIFNQQEDGSWAFNTASDSISKRTNWDEGVAGILHVLIYASGLGVIEDLDDSISKAATWLTGLIVQNHTHILIPQIPSDNSGRYDLFTGLFGVMKGLKELDTLSVTVSEIYDWMLKNAIYDFSIDEKNYSGLIPTSYHARYLDLSFAEGLSGIVVELLDLMDESSLSVSRALIMNKINQLVSTLILFQNPEGSWNKQVSTEGIKLPDFVKTSRGDSNESFSPSMFVVFSAFVLLVGSRRIISKNLLR